MLKAMSAHRRVLSDFIRLYRSEPCLWMVKSQEYRDRMLKESAYERLIQKLKEIDSTADREKVVKKINSLRTNYRKEKRKIEEWPGPKPYTPRLWYYHMFDFLEDQADIGSPFNDYSNTKDEYLDSFDEDDTTADPLIYNQIQQEVEEEEQQTHGFKLCHNDSIAGEEEIVPQTPTSIKRALSIKRKRSPSLDDSDSMHFGTTDPYTENKMKQSEDRFDVFGRNVAMKLRHLTNNTQRLLAEKLVNDTLFMAELGELTMDDTVNAFNISTRFYTSNADLDSMPSQTHNAGIEDQIVPNRNMSAPFRHMKRY